MRAHPPMPLQVWRQACLAAPPSPAHRSPMHAAVSALQDISQCGAAAPENATAATASAATRRSRMLLASCIVRPPRSEVFLAARHPPRCLSTGRHCEPLSPRPPHMCPPLSHLPIGEARPDADPPTTEGGLAMV